MSAARVASRVVYVTTPAPAFRTSRFQDALDALLAAARWGAADPPEVLATAERVLDGDPDSWLLEWTATAGAAWAGSDHLRAATYYAAALELAGEGDGAVSERDLAERQRVCWERAVAHLGGEQLAIPYEDTALPGAFFPAPGAPPGEARPLVVIDHGGRHSSAHAWARGGAAAAAAGHHWMTFDGPGRSAEVRGKGLLLRPDWEAVLTPVADAMAARADVDAARMAVVGLGDAGYGVLRALASEHRFAAAVADPGIVDASTPWTQLLPDAARAQLLREAPAAFDREIHLARPLRARAAPADRARGPLVRPGRHVALRALPARCSASGSATRSSRRSPPRCCCAPASRSTAGPGRPRGCRRGSATGRSCCAPDADGSTDDEVAAWLGRALAVRHVRGAHASDVVGY